MRLRRIWGLWDGGAKYPGEFRWHEDNGLFAAIACLQIKLAIDRAKRKEQGIQLRDIHSIQHKLVSSFDKAALGKGKRMSDADLVSTHEIVARNQPLAIWWQLFKLGWKLVVLSVVCKHISKFTNCQPRISADAYFYAHV